MNWTFDQALWQSFGLQTWQYADDAVSPPVSYTWQGVHGFLRWQVSASGGGEFLHNVARALLLTQVFSVERPLAQILWGVEDEGEIPGARTLRVKAPEHYLVYPEEQSVLWASLLAFHHQGWYNW